MDAYSSTLQRARAEALDLLQAEHAWAAVTEDEGIVVSSLAHAESGGRVLRARGVVEGVAPQALFEAVYHQTLAEKHALGNTFVTEDHVVEPLPALSVHAMVRRQTYKIKWPIADREVVSVRDAAPHDGGWLQWEASVDHPKVRPGPMAQRSPH